MVFADMHCDTVTKLSKQNLRSNSLHLDLEKMQKAGYLIQNFAVFINKEKTKTPYRDCLAGIEIFYKEMKANSDLISPVTTYREIENNISRNKMSALLTIEEGTVLEGKVERIKEFYDNGVRMLTLTWNYPNELGFPNVDILPYIEGKVDQPQFHIPETIQGLTQTGIYFVEEMERLGMIVDVSHGSDALFYDVANHTKKPFVASHSNARAFCPHNRNLSDDMIRVLANRGGIMGINFCADFLNSKADNICYLQDIVKHIQHIRKIGGIDIIGLGSDFDGIENELEMKDASGMLQLIDILQDNGFSMSEIDKITHENVLRIYRELL